MLAVQPVPCAESLLRAQTASRAEFLPRVGPAPRSEPTSRAQTISSHQSLVHAQSVVQAQPRASAPKMAAAQTRAVSLASVSSAIERNVARVGAALRGRWQLARIGVVIGVTIVLVALASVAHRGTQQQKQAPKTGAVLATNTPRATVPLASASAPRSALRSASSSASELASATRSAPAPQSASASASAPASALASASASPSLSTSAAAPGPAAATLPPIAPTPAPVSEPVNNPVRFKNPFDSSEVFEFPPGTTTAEARQAVASILLERGRERRAQLRSVSGSDPRRASTRVRRGSL